MDPRTFRPSPITEVEARPDGDRWTLVFVRDLPHPPPKAWRALTDRDRLRRWSPFEASRDLGTVGDATLTMVDGVDGEREEAKATVLRAEAPTLLEYVWGSDLLRWELAGTDSGTRLTLRHSIEDRGLVPKVAAGWHLCLDVADRLLAGDVVQPIRGAEAHAYGWADLAAAYGKKLGIDPVD
jgi:uncharacterized protein YndB with AHSA1/START domain